MADFRKEGRPCPIAHRGCMEAGPVVHHIRKARDPVLKIPVGICPCIQHRHADAPPRKPQGIGVPAADLFLYTIHI